MTVLSPREYVVGASAGVYGLLFSHLSTIILNWNEMDRKCCRLFWLIFYIVLNFSLEFIITDFNVRKKYNFNASLFLNSTKKINFLFQNSLAGHLGGAITGFLVSILVLKNFEKHPWEKKMQTICLGVLVALFIVIIIINLTASTLHLPTEWNFNYTSTYENFIVNLVAESAKGSMVRKQCQVDVRCMVLMLQNNVTVF